MSFDTKLLGNPDGDGPEREREWSRLFHTMTPRLRLFFARRVQTGDELDDLVSGVWQRAVLRIATLTEPDALWAWLVTIGVNLVNDRRREEMRRNRRLGQPIPLDAAQADELVTGRLVGDILSITQFREAAELIREHVSARDWELLHLWAVDELTHAEIAERMALASAVASRQHVSRLCRRLRKELASALKEVA